MPADRLFHKRLGHSAKVSALTDFENRIWMQYELSADDFGVMRKSAVALQADNDNLAKRPATTVLRALKHLVTVGLLVEFEHQLHVYVCQWDWQDWQKVTWPARTIHPCPPPALLATFTPWTQLLFTVHPGAQKAPKKPDESPADEHQSADSGTPDVLQSNSGGTPAPRARVRAERLTANGYRLMADGSEGGAGETFDGVAALKLLQADYPKQRVTFGYKTETAFIEAVHSDHQPAATFVLMQANLEHHCASHEWRVKGMAPALDKWLREGLWRREMSDQAPAGEQVAKSTNVTLQAASNLMNRRPA